MNMQGKFVSMGELHNEYLKVANKVAGQYAKIASVAGIMLGGSFSRGYTDKHSDMEMYVYYRGELPPKATIRSILQTLNATLTRSKNLHWYFPAWGYHTFFEVDGVKFELGYRNIDEIRKRMKRFLLSRTVIFPQPGIHDTPFGHYESGVASCIKESIILCERKDGMKKLKKLVENYPKQPKKRNLKYYFTNAKVITEVKIKQAVTRNDTYHFNACVARVTRSIVLCLFALNETYYPGDKWNQEYIAKFTIKPDQYEKLIAQVFFLPDASLEAKKRKCQLFGEIIAKLEPLVEKVLAGD